MASKIIPANEAKKIREKQRPIVHFIQKIDLYFGRKAINRQIKKARRKGKYSIKLGYCISEKLEEELKKKGYGVDVGCMGVAGMICPYTIISL